MVLNLHTHNSQMHSEFENFFFRMEHFHMSDCTQQIIFKMFIFHRYCVINSCPEIKRRKNRIDKVSWIIKTTATFFNLHFRCWFDVYWWCWCWCCCCFYFCSTPIAQNCIFNRMKMLTYAHRTSDATLNHLTNGHGFSSYYKRYVQIIHIAIAFGRRKTEAA